jgi:hypothetical protein
MTGGNIPAAVAAYQIGSMVGNAIDPPKGPTIHGPRLNDLRVQTSTYGANIPRIYGTVATFGNVFWVENNQLKESVKKKKSGGKGGGGGGSTIKTYSYSSTFAVGLCKGPIEGVRRIWVGSKLIYDAGASDIESIIASNRAATGFAIYTGSTTQMPDPRMQAAIGAANCPAYRGLAYIVLYDYPLADHGNSLLGAQVKVEVVSDASFAVRDWEGFASPLTGLRQVATGNDRMVVVGPGSKSMVSILGQPWQTGLGMTADMNNLWGVAFGAGVFVAMTRFPSYATSPDGLAWTMGTLINVGDTNLAITYGGGRFVIVGGTALSQYSVTGLEGSWNNAAMPSALSWIDVAYGTDPAGEDVYVAVAANTDQAAFSQDAVVWQAATLPATAAWESIAFGNGVFIAVASDSSATAMSTDGENWVAGSAPAVGARQRIMFGGGLFLLTGFGGTSATSPDGVTWTGQTMPFVDYTWKATGYGNGIFVAFDLNAKTNYAQYVPGAVISSGSSPLSSIVEAECLQSNVLASGDLDVTALTQQVRGYRVTQTGAIRGALEPLQAAWPFDVVQSGYELKFVPRGGSSVATIPATDLDARQDSDAPGVQLTIAHEMDTQLPREVRVKYLDVTREYDDGDQPATRQNTDSIHIRDVELPIVLNAVEAAGMAEVLLYLYWLERRDVQFKLPPSYRALEPADVITITGEWGEYSLRLTGVHLLSDGRLECSAKYNAPAIYTPTAVGVESLNTGQVIALDGPSLYVLLDVPMMRDEDDMPGFPVAMSGYTTGWPGGIIFQSPDDGQTWEDIQGFTGPVPIGYARGTIGAGRVDIIDSANRLQVDLVSGALESVSQLTLFGGANHFAYGAHGRWEILGAANCVLQGDGSYMLSDFLRGRFGTEQYMTTHVAGDQVVLLTDGDMGFVTVQTNSIGSARTYRGITAGRSIDDDEDRSFTYAGVNLECLSPVYLNGNRHPSTNDWTLTWIRRGRVSPTWRNLVDVPLGELTEAYEIEVYTSAAYTTLKRTLTSSTPTVAYTSAQQVTDFGSNQATLHVKIYQMSATVGRGYPLSTSITR